MARYDADKHHRRSIRLRGWDYTQTGAYFVTICTHRGECLFDDPTLRDITERTWQELRNRFPSIALDEFVVMPNHVHFIVWLNLQGDDDSDVGAQLNCALRVVPLMNQLPSGFGLEWTNNVLHWAKLCAPSRRWSLVASIRSNRTYLSPGSATTTNASSATSENCMPSVNTSVTIQSIGLKMRRTRHAVVNLLASTDHSSVK